jgi:hypothetical protein
MLPVASLAFCATLYMSIKGLRLIHTYHAVPMPFPCRSPAMPFRYGFRLCLSQLIYTVCPCLIHTNHAAPMPFPCHATTMPFWQRPLKATAQRGMRAAWERHGQCKLESAVQRRNAGDLPAFGFFRLTRRIPRRLLPEAD